MRGMLWRRVLKRSGLLDSKSHQRMTGFQRPPINTSSCSMGHMLAINLALITAPVTRYPFGAWYLLDGIKRDYMPARMNSKKRREEQDTYGRPEIANVAQPATERNIASPGPPGASKRPE